MGFLDTIRTSTPLSARLFRASEVATKGWEELRAGITAVSSHGSGNLVPTVQTVEALNKYRSWIYPCVSLISRKVSEVPFYLYKDQGKRNREEFERILDHPMIKLLKNPNKYLSGRQLKSIIQMWLDLCGFACVKILRRASGQPYELHPMFPHELVEIQLGTDTDNVIKAFHFAPLNNRQKREVIPYEDCLYFHYPHPANPYRPFTPIQAIKHVTDLDLYLQVYEKDFFHNSARPDFVIIPDRQISEPSAHRMQEGWIARHRGPGKHFKPAVLSESVKIQEISMSARDFEFVGLAGFTKDHILAAYHVPEAMLGLFQSFNKASSITAETIFVNNSINERLDLYEDVINHQLLPLYRNPEGLEFEHANAKPKDDEWDLARNTSELSSGLVSPNEIRKREGLQPWPSPLMDIPWINGEPVPGNNPEADKIWAEKTAAAMMPAMPGAIPGQDPNAVAGTEAVPQITSNDPTAQGAMGQLGGRPELPQTPMSTMVAETLRSSRPALSNLLAASRGKRGGLAALIVNNPGMGSIGAALDGDRTDLSMRKLLTKEIHDYIEEGLSADDRLVFKTYEEMIGELQPLEEDLIKKSESYYVEKGIEIADIVQKMFNDIVIKGEDGVNDIDTDELREDYKQSIAEFANKAVDIGYRSGFKLVQKAGGQVGNPDVFDEASKAAAGKFLDRSADLKVRSTKKALRGIIQDGLAQGLDSVETAELIKKRFAWIGSQRAELIAVTEIAAATWAGQDAAYEQINKDAGKVVVKRANFWTSLDERVCKECNEKEGDPIKDYETDTDYIDMPPHPRCRCTGRPVLV